MKLYIKKKCGFSFYAGSPEQVFNEFKDLANTDQESLWILGLNVFMFVIAFSVGWIHLDATFRRGCQKGVLPEVAYALTVPGDTHTAVNLL